MLRNSLRLTALCAGLLLGANAMALSLGSLSQGDATGGLKDALTQGAQIAVKQLGVPGGFSNNPEVKIGLPGKLGKVADKLKMFGMGDQVNQLEASMNKAAESAVTQAQQYNALAGKAATFGAIDAKSANVESYVTEQALDGLFKMIAQQEETIRKNPAAAATSLAKKVFGAL